MASLNLLEAHGLTRHFGGIAAVDNVDFEIPAGDIRALIGPNGAGKTTFVSLLTGRVAASKGTVHFAGRNISRMSAHRRIGLGIAYTFQITSIFKNLTCFENARLASMHRLHGKRAGKINDAAMYALEQVGLHTFSQRPARDLSYGHQRLLEISMGLAQKPLLLILDEPTQGLAMAEVRDFVALIREIGQNTTILLIEHNMDVVMNLARTITVMDQGKIIAEGSPDAVRENALVQEAYLGS